MSLERVRNRSWAVTLALLPVLVVAMILGAWNEARPPWEAIYLVVSALILAASTTFTVTAIALAMRRTRQDAAGDRRPGERSRPAIRLLGLIALGANLAVIGLSGRVNALNVVLALLVGLFLLLLHEHARREGIRDRTR